jgi:hypothetical protein
VVATGVAVGLAALLVVHRQDSAAPVSTPAGNTPAATGTPSSPGVSPVEVKIARPKVVRARIINGGHAVVLRWRLSRAARDIPVFVHKAPGDKRPVPLKNGALTTTIGHLNPKLGYCFQVFTMVAPGDPPTLAKAAPRCIRGAVPR